jgi:hypothetical protein
MAKKKLAVNLKPINNEIVKAQKALRGLKKKVSGADSDKIDLHIEKLKGAADVVAEICKGKMTAGFDPS